MDHGAITPSAAQRFYEAHYGRPPAELWWDAFRRGTWPPPAPTGGLQQGDPRGIQGLTYGVLSGRAPFGRVLDIGCSAGDFLVPLRAVGTEAHGVDIVSFPGAWDILRDRFDIHCRVHDVDQAPLPFPNGHFDVVTALAVLEHVFDVDRALSEIRRVLAPGGVAVIQVPNLAYVKRRWDLLRGVLPITADASDRDFEKGWDGQHLHGFTRRALDVALARNRLRPRRHLCTGRLAALRSRWPSLLGADLVVVAEPIHDSNPPT